MSQGWSPPPPPVLLPPSRALALVGAATALCLLAPVLAFASLLAVFFAMDQFLALEDACTTYACGEGVGFALVLFAVGWMCAIWVIGLVAAAIATWKTISVARALIAASITAVVVAMFAAVIDFAWVVWSV